MEGWTFVGFLGGRGGVVSLFIFFIVSFDSEYAHSEGGGGDGRGVLVEVFLLRVLWCWLKRDCAVAQEILALLDPGMQDSLKEVYTKSLKKLAAQNDPGIDDIDDTVLR